MNAAPSEEVVVYGTGLDAQGLDLRMTARFESKSRWCGNFVDLSHAYALSETIDVDVRNDGDRYEARFYRDAIAKGACDWTFMYASAELVDKAGGRAWLKLYPATPEDLAKQHLRSVLHPEEDHHFKVKCLGGARPGAARPELDCGAQGIFLMPGVHRYHVDFAYATK